MRGTPWRHREDMEMMLPGLIQRIPGLIPRAHINVVIGDPLRPNHFQGPSRRIILVPREGALRVETHIATPAEHRILQKGGIRINPIKGKRFRETQ